MTAYMSAFMSTFYVGSVEAVFHGNGSLRAFAGDAVARGHGAVQCGDAGAVGVALGVA
jgi:hypothetical protein